MPQFKNREEYERWKAERMRQVSQKKEDAPGGESGGPLGQGPEKKPAEPSSSGLSAVGELFRNSWEIYKQRAGTLLALYLFTLLCALAVGAFFGGSGFLLSLVLSGAKGPLIATGIFFGILAAVVVMSWGMGAIVFGVTDSNLGFREALGRGWQRVWAFIWLFSISGFIITGGFLLFLIPGVLFLVWFAFGQFILASDDERGMSALLKSKGYVKGHWFDVFLRLFLIWLVSVVIGAVPFIGPLLLIAFMPYMMIFVYQIYSDLKSLKGDIVFSSSSGEKFKLIGAGVLGYLLVPVIIIAVMGASIDISLLLLKNMVSSAAKEAVVSSLSSASIDREVEKAYQDYRAAFLSGDIEALKTLVVSEKARELEGSAAPAMIQMARALSPEHATVTGTSVSGDTATVFVSGDNATNGNVQMRKEEGRWKLLNEDWKMSLNAEGLTSEQTETRRPYEYHRITGTWKGREAGKSGDEWEITLGGGYDLAATGPGGQYYRANAVVEDNLGVQGNSLRVLPGGAPFDLRITAASDASYVGKTSLGSYKLMGDVLQICGSEPGLMKRTSDFASAGGIRCFELSRVSGPIVMSEPAAQSPQPAQPLKGSSPFSKQDPGIAGEAVVVLDGKTETYPLATGFFSDTRLKEANRATVQFQVTAPEHSNARRIELTLDATRTGAHYAEGKLLSENFMSSDKIRIGERTAQGLTASFRWVADGGQIYFPKPSCAITVTSAYSGASSSVFSGEVRDCAVHSAGIDHHLSSVKFIVRGASAR